MLDRPASRVVAWCGARCLERWRRREHTITLIAMAWLATHVHHLLWPSCVIAKRGGKHSSFKPQRVLYLAVIGVVSY
jgi:hypothetical protein